MNARERRRLTDARIARLRPREREYTVWDTVVAGLGVRVRPSGGASFIVLRKCGGGSRRVSLGSVASRRVEDVRRECHADMARTEPGKSTEPTRQSPVFRDFAVGSWKETRFPRYKPATRRGASASLVRQLLPAFGSTPLGSITRNQVLCWFDAYSRTAPGGANHVLPTA